nr:hypothetical protein [uncultured Dyadobacter sp.]
MHPEQSPFDDLSEIKEEMRRDFHQGGFLLSNPHFEVGRQLHIKQFYYAKKYLSSVPNSVQIANHIAKKITALQIPIQQLSIIGSGDFFAITLKATTDILNSGVGESGRCNYAIVDNRSSELSFLYQPELKKNILIILPLSCTFATAFEIIEFIRKADKVGEINVIPQIISVFLAADRKLPFFYTDKEKTIDFTSENLQSGESRMADLSKLYRSFGWIRITDGVIELSPRDTSEPFLGHYLISLESDLYLAENCPLCFPPKELSSSEVLFPTRINRDTPNLIFGLPKFKNRRGEIKTQDFNDVFKNTEKTGHLYGHLDHDSTSYRHFIETDTFYQNNKEEILEFFSGQLRERYLSDNIKTENILIITPSNGSSSRFMEDFCALPLFEGKVISIKAVNPHIEFIENFLYDNVHSIERYDRVFFFDYVISRGKTFKLISDYLKASNPFEKGFDALFTFIDRTTTFSKREILRKLYSSSNKDDKCFIAFSKINAPVVDAEYSGNPINEINNILINMSRECHFDFLKVDIKRKLFDGRAMAIEDLRIANEGYGPDKRSRYLQKLRVTHEISAWFFEFKNIPKIESFTIDDLHLLISWVTDKSSVYYPGPVSDTNEIIIKTLSQSPFKFYKDLYFAVSKFVETRILEMMQEIAVSGYSEVKLTKFNFYIKRSVELNSNLMISTEFILCLKKIFENYKTNYVSFNTFVRYYKELILNSPERAIKLEELLNSKELLPRAISNNSQSISATFADKFYQFGRILKSENSNILSEIKEDFKAIPNSTFNDVNLDQFIEQRYFHHASSRANITVKNLQDFLKKSKENVGMHEFKREIPRIVANSVTHMLKTVRLIKQKTQVSVSFDEDILEILKSACKIVSDGELSFSFCIEFRDYDGITADEIAEGMAPNIYSIKSSPDYDSLSGVSTKGLAYNLLKGIHDQTQDNLQTFLAIAKGQDGIYESFSNKYRRGSGTKGNDDRYDEIDINEAIREDIHASNLVNTNSGLLLYLRLAEVDMADDRLSRGHAVLIISMDKPATTTNLIDFINIERLRNLLLVKDELLQYLMSQFENGAFIGLLEGKRELQAKNAMEHMVGKYFDALDYIVNEKGEDDDQAIINYDDMVIIKFIHKTIYRHIRSVSRLNINDNRNSFADAKEIEKYNEGDLSSLFSRIASIPHLARRILVNPSLLVNVKEFELPLVIFEQVIPELMINMRKYSLTIPDCDHIFEISLDDKMLSFSNRYDPHICQHPEVIKTNGGKDMCNYLLRSCGMEPLMQTFNETSKLFTISIILR